MNKEKLLNTYNAIKNSNIESLKFNMRRYFTEGRDPVINACGTAACIAGWAVAVEDGVQRLKEISYTNDAYYEGNREGETPISVRQRATEIFEIDHEEADALFEPYCGSVYILNKITKKHALATLKRFIDTGVIDWQASEPKNFFN